MDWDESHTVVRWWLYWKLLDGLWQALVMNAPVSLICNGLAAYFRHSPYRQGLEGAAIATLILTLLNVALILFQRRPPWRTEFPREPLTHSQLEELANLLTRIAPREIHLIRDDFAFDCVEIGNQLQKFFINLNWPVTRPSSTFYEPIKAGIRVRAMASDQTAEAIRNALARVLKISVGAEPPGTQNINWVEIEIGRIL
jgi:hypothetical protein